MTATDVADAAAGTYGGIYAVVARKLGLWQPEMNDAMQRGHDWQPVIADAVHTLTGLYVVGEETWVEQYPGAMIRATVDGFLSDRPVAEQDNLLGVVEIKTRGVGTRPNRDRWIFQMQWQMLATGLDRALLAEATIDDVDNECRGVRLHWYEADANLQADLTAVAADIYEHMLDGTLPDPDTPAALDVVTDIYGTADTSDPVDLEAEFADLCADWRQLKDAIKEADDARKVVEAQIRERIGHATRGQVDGWQVKIGEPSLVLTDEGAANALEDHPEYGHTVLDRARFRKEEPKLYKTYQARQGARRITVTQEDT